MKLILIGAKKQHEDKIEAEKKAEAERVEKLRLEAEEKETTIGKRATEI